MQQPQKREQISFQELNIEKEAEEMASRIIEKVRQKSNAKSYKKSTDYLRASDYKARQVQYASVTDRNDLLSPQFPSSMINQIENAKTPQKPILKSSTHIGSDTQDRFNRTNKNYYMDVPKPQKPDSTKLIKLMNNVNSIIQKESSPKHRKIDSITHTKSTLSLKTSQLQTPIKQKQIDIVSQLLGSLKNNKKYQE